MPLKGEKHEKSGIGGAFSTLLSGDNTEVRDAQLDDSGNVTSTSRAERDNAQYRKAAQLATAPAQASMAQQQGEGVVMGQDINRMRQEGIGGMQDSAGLARNLATQGDEASQAIYRRGSDDAMKQARSLAASTSGGAGAQIAAARSGMSRAADTTRQMSNDAAQEMANAKRQGLQMYGQQQGQIANTMGQVGQLQGSMADRSMARAQLENQQATSQLQADMGQRQANDAFFMANQGLMSGRDQQQLQAYMQKSHDQANIDSGGDAGSLSMGSSAAGGGLSVLGGLAMMSDKRSKTIYSDEDTKNMLGMSGVSDEAFLKHLSDNNMNYGQLKQEAQEKKANEVPKSGSGDGTGTTAPPKGYAAHRQAAYSKKAPEAFKAFDTKAAPEKPAQGKLTIDYAPPITLSKPGAGVVPYESERPPATPPKTPIGDRNSAVPGFVGQQKIADGPARQKSASSKTISDAELTQAMRTPFAQRGHNDDYEGDTPEMAANRAKVGGNLAGVLDNSMRDELRMQDDPNYLERKDLRAFDDAQQRKAPGANEATWAKQEQAGRASLPNEFELKAMGFDPRDSRAQKLMAIPDGPEREAAAKWLKVDKAKEARRLEDAEIGAGLRPARDEGFDTKGLFKGLGSALKGLGSGFSGKQADNSDELRKELADQKTKFAEIQKQVDEYQKYRSSLTPQTPPVK